MYSSLGKQWKPVAHYPLSLELGAPRMPLSGLFESFFVVDLWLLLASPYMGSTLRLAYCEDHPDHSVWAPLCVLTTQSGIGLSRVWCLLRPHFASAACEANWTLLWCCLKHSSLCVFSGSSWEGLCCGLMWELLAIGPGQIVWSYKVIHSLWLLLLVWVCIGKRPTCKTKPASTSIEPGTGQEKAQGTLIFTSTCLTLKADSKVCLWKSLW